jgi:chromosome partitioning protein
MFHVKLPDGEAPGEPSGTVRAGSRHTLGRPPGGLRRRRKSGISARIEGSEDAPTAMLVRETIACANQKGGVGKTTTVVSLATYLALRGRRVLVLDLDPQGNATSGLGLDRATLTSSAYEALIDGRPLAELVAGTGQPGLDLVPSAIGLAAVEVELAATTQRERRLARSLDGTTTAYDFVLIDCPPSLGLLTVNALTAATSVMIPLQCEYYALEGLGQLLATVDLVRDHLNPDLAVDGVVLTMYDGRTRLSADVAAEARRHLGPMVYRTIIPRSVRLSEAPSYGRTIATYSPESRGALAYEALTEEFLDRRRPRPTDGTPDRTDTTGARTVDATMEAVA